MGARQSDLEPSLKEPQSHPTSLPDWPRQDLRGNRLPGHRYTSREFFALEWEHMWTKVWLLLGRCSEIPDPGDWQREDVGPESILMVRQTDGGIRAFYNVCQHRGNQLVTGAKGHVNRFVCRYHSWAFLPDGELVYAQDAKDFPEGDPCHKVNLVELRCETFAGFIWVNMDPDCVSLKEYLGPIWDHWSRYEIEKWKRYLALTTTLPCNWKVVLDKFNESYHVPTVHKPVGTPEERKRMHSGVDTNYKRTRFDLSDQGHNRMIMAGGYAGVSLNPEARSANRSTASCANGAWIRGTLSAAAMKPARPCRTPNAGSFPGGVTATTRNSVTNNLPTPSTTPCSRISQYRSRPTVSTFCGPCRTRTTRRSAFSTTGGTRASRRVKPHRYAPQQASCRAITSVCTKFLPLAKKAWDAPSMATWRSFPCNRLGSGRAATAVPNWLDRGVASVAITN